MAGRRLLTPRLVRVMLLLLLPGCCTRFLINAQPSARPVLLCLPPAELSLGSQGLPGSAEPGVSAQVRGAGRHVCCCSITQLRGRSARLIPQATHALACIHSDALTSRTAAAATEA